MPVSGFLQASLDRQIDRANTTIAMLQDALTEIGLAHGDTTIARHYLRKTEKHLDELRQERSGLQEAPDFDSSQNDDTRQSFVGTCGATRAAALQAAQEQLKLKRVLRLDEASFA
jgi:hypothetical protein